MRETNTPISVATYPQAILHIDADAFFASVEQALRPELRGKPLVTGQERGIIACPSYEAKALGIRRGLPLHEAREICPDLVVLPSDYETYSLFSKRMFDIIRRYTPAVEEYSIDEAFADMTGMRRLHRASYEDIGRRIQSEIHNELDLTVSVGLSLTKTLAKLCSKFRKPNGFTGVRGRHIHLLLQRIPIDNVWGFGPNTAAMLHKFGLRTAYDYVMRPEQWARATLHKPGHDLWHELRGNSMWKVCPDDKQSYATIVKSKTFTPPSSDRDFVYAKLIRNLENALAKARRYTLRARAIGVVLRHQDFGHAGLEARMNRPTAATTDIVPVVRKVFERIFNPQQSYRSSMIVLGALESDRSQQYELFEEPLRIDKLRRVSLTLDRLNEQFGKYTVRAATSLFLETHPDTPRETRTSRFDALAKGETERRHLRIPRLGIKV